MKFVRLEVVSGFGASTFLPLLACRGASSVLRIRGCHDVLLKACGRQRRASCKRRTINLHLPSFFLPICYTPELCIRVDAVVFSFRVRDSVLAFSCSLISLGGLSPQRRKGSVDEQDYHSSRLHSAHSAP